MDHAGAGSFARACDADTDESVAGADSVRARPIVHIGMHKTGTSWFQSAVWPRAISHAFLDRGLVRRTLLGGSAFGFDPAAARAALGFDRAGAPPLICEEDLSGVLHNGGLCSALIAKEVATRLHAVAPEARIVLFVRNPLDAAASCYHQYVREGGTGRVLRYLFPDTHRHLGHDRPFKIPRFDWSQLDQADLIAHYDRLFGRANVHVYPVELLKADCEGLVARMRRELGVTLDARAVCAPRANDSYRAGLLPLARILNLFTARSVADKRTLLHIPFWYAIRKVLLARLNRLALFGRRPSPAALVGASAAAWIAQRFAAGNRRLAGRLGIDLAALGYAVDGPRDPIAPPCASHWRRWLEN